MGIRNGLLVTTLMASVAFVSTEVSAETLRVSYNVTEGSSWDQAAREFKDLVEERTEGRYTIELYPNATLAQGNDRVEIEMAQAGAIDIVIKSSAWLSSLDERWAALALPWIFPDHEAANRVLDGEPGDALDARLEEQGLVPLAWSESGGFFHIYTVGQPVDSPDDLSGLRMRMPSIPPWVGVFEELGAVPVTMSFAEVFPSLQAGSIDGGTSQVGLFHSSRFYEVAKYMTFLNFAWDAIGVLVSDVRWSQLSEDDQEIFHEAAREAMAFHRDLVQSEEADLIADLEDEGVTFIALSDDELEAFREIAAPVYERYREEIDADFVGMIEAEVEAYLNEQ